MIRYADPEVCPCCRMQIPYAAAQCTHCGAVLTGPVAQGLFRTLTHADALVAQLTAPPRSPSAWALPSPARRPRPVPAARRVDPTYPSFPAPAPAGRRHGLSAASVPRILLGLGATCLLVAAVVFLAVAWSDLGMGARTAILLTLTAGAAAATGWMGRRGLPAGAEAFGVVFLGFLTLDVFGAQDAGWFGGLGDDGFLVLLGSVLTVAAIGTAAGVDPHRDATAGRRPARGRRRRDDRRRRGHLADRRPERGRAGRDRARRRRARPRRPPAAPEGRRGRDRRRRRPLVARPWSASGSTASATEPTLAGVWTDLGGWPLLAAAALAAAPALLRSLPLPVRVAGASVGVAPAHRRRGGTGRGRVHPDPGPRRARRRRRRRRPLAGHLRRLALAPGRPDRRRRPRAHRPGHASSAARRSRPSSTTGSGRSAPGSTCSPPPSRATGRCCSR